MSVVNVRSVQPSTVALEGATVQSIDTFDRYQPEQFAGAGVHSKVTLGTASAPDAANQRHDRNQDRCDGNMTSAAHRGAGTYRFLRITADETLVSDRKPDGRR